MNIISRYLDRRVDDEQESDPDFALNAEPDQDVTADEPTEDQGDERSAAQERELRPSAPAEKREQR